jgi:hypothetical protein
MTNSKAKGYLNFYLYSSPDGSSALACYGDRTGTAAACNYACKGN